MTKSIKVGVKFCGNCNPHVDAAFLLEQIKIIANDIEFVHMGKHFDVLLLLNSCPVGCATPPDFTGPSVIVTSNSVNYFSTPSEQLTDKILQALHESF